MIHTEASVKRGRKPIVTPERVNMICELLARGESERSACIRAGIGLTAWGAAKRNSADLRERISTARDQWAQIRHSRHATALHESQAMRSANRKAFKPQPTHQAKLVVWHLIYRVPLYWADHLRRGLVNPFLTKRRVFVAICLRIELDSTSPPLPLSRIGIS